MSGFFRYSDLLSRFRHLKLKKPKICEACCVSGHHGTYLKYQNFPIHFPLSLFLECFGEIGRKSVKSVYPINSLNVKQLAPELAPRQEIVSPPETANQWDNGTSWCRWRLIKIFREKQPIADTFFYLDRSVERLGGRYNHVQSCQRQRKKPAIKIERPENELRNKRTDRQTAFKITICIKAGTCISNKKPRFKHYVWQSLIRRWLFCLKCGRQRGAPPVPIALLKYFFSFLDRMVLFLSSLGLFFFLLFSSRSFSAFNFSMGKDFSISKEPKDERLPQKFPQGTLPGRRLWHLPDLLTFIWKYVFLNNSGAFEDFRNFFNINVRLIQFSQIKEKSIFSAPEGGK